ncbi:SWIRM-domain-containing protein [Meredithblackwellia eburnea MCA 4105]
MATPGSPGTKRTLDESTAQVADPKRQRTDTNDDGTGDVKFEDAPAATATGVPPPPPAAADGIDESQLNLTGIGPKDDPISVARRLTTARRYLASQTHPVIIPSYSTWFNLSTIHPLERRSLPEFFNSRNRSKVPAIYKDYRDFMINTYRLNPSEYLTVTACRRNLAGDVCAIMRVHAFLEQWGLINYQIDVDTRPAPLAPPFTGHFRILVDTPRGLAPLHPGTKPKSTTTTTSNNTTGPAATPSGGAELRKDILQTDPSQPGKPETRVTEETASAIVGEASTSVEEGAGGGEGEDGPTVTITPCSTCGTTTTTTRYSSLKSRGTFSVCVACYSEGRFPSTLNSGDFVRLSSGPYAHSSDDGWSEQETLLLLEGIEMWDEDWDKVANHVGSRTKEQCIVHFLQLPIEDPFLEATQKDLGPLQYAKTPFSKADNPILSVMAFLAATVDRDVAAAAAGRSIEELEKGLRKKAKEAGEKKKETNGTVGEEKEDGSSTEKGKEKEVEKEDESGEKEKESEEMDVDGAKEDGAAEKEKDKDKEGEGERGSSDSIKETKDSSTTSPRNNVEKAAAIALGSAAAKAHILALEEDATLHSLVTSVIEAQVRKLELKMAYFDQLESLVEVERRGVEQGKQQLYEDRLKCSRVMFEVQALHARAKQGQQQAAAISQQEMGHMLQGAGAINRPQAVAQPGPAPVVPEDQTVTLATQ